ncbi:MULTISPECIES: DUF58 domain-containing protein [Marinomonas]|mgnify:CR=1 FL=1|jgi:hypothetical protein|uniref:DUF58 domain-containing protein n=1 Tax=Marinomonas TaxID=28253 RepID=UPI001055805F|nr:DUF58 domain-containing protein [Marinomonas sp. KMM3893]
MNPLLSPTSPELNDSDFALLAHYAKHLGRASSAARFTLKSGEKRSKKKGHGMEMLELRPYQTSDDLRHIDWRVTARTGHTHTRLYAQENDHQRILLLDLSPDAYFSTRYAFISTRFIQLAGLIAWRSEQQGDKLLYNLSFGGQSLEHLNKSSVWGMISQLKNASKTSNRNHQATSDLGWYGSKVTSKARNKDIIILTDKQHWDAKQQTALQQLAKHNQIHWVQIFDHHSFELPPGQYQFADAMGTTSVKISKKSSEQAKKDFFEQNATMRQRLAKIGIRHQLFDISEPPEGIARYLLNQGALR